MEVIAISSLSDEECTQTFSSLSSEALSDTLLISAGVAAIVINPRHVCAAKVIQYIIAWSVCVCVCVYVYMCVCVCVCVAVCPLRSRISHYYASNNKY